MGYTTYFMGQFDLNKPLTPEQARYLREFNHTRRMKRDEAIAATLPDPVREAVGLPVGPEGAYFVGGAGFMGQDGDASVIDPNTPPGGVGFPASALGDDGTWAAYRADKAQAIDSGTAQPGLWCQWVPSDDLTAIEWDEGEKFYEYVPWIRYLITHFLAPWGYVLNGSVHWEGEEGGDLGYIDIKDNVVTVRKAVITYEEVSE